MTRLLIEWDEWLGQNLISVNELAFAEARESMQSLSYACCFFRFHFQRIQLGMHDKLSTDMGEK